MIPINEAKIISELFYRLDMNVRNDLHHKRIADERDYVSRLVTHFNYPFGIFQRVSFNGIHLQSKWFSKVNDPDHEKKFGCDSMIVFRVNDEIKVGLFEAKWPRVIKKPKYRWDYAQKSNKRSHFTDQILRQARWTNYAAIWEMFLYEEKVGTLNCPFDKYASTCVRHNFAKAFVRKTPSLKIVWNNIDLTDLIQSAQTSSFNGTNQTNIKDIVLDILTCKFGKAIDIKPGDTGFKLTSKYPKEVVKCPIIPMTEDDDINSIIGEFMAENGLSFFQQLNIVSPNEKKNRKVSAKQTTPVHFQDECLERVQKYLNIRLIKQTKSSYASKVKTTGLICSISKAYKQGQFEKYWFAFHPHQMDFLKSVENAYVSYGCGSPDNTLLIPFKDFEPLIKNLWKTDNDDRRYWHVVIHFRDNKYFIAQPILERGSMVDITRYRIL